MGPVGAAAGFFGTALDVGLGIADDLNQDRKIAGLKQAEVGLKESQSLLEGQMTDLQAGLRDATAKQSEFQAQLSQIESDLETATNETKQELELQKAALESKR